jgi:hypothetical protein
MVFLTDVLRPRRDAQIFVRAAGRVAILRLGNGLGGGCPEMGMVSFRNFDFLGPGRGAGVVALGLGGWIGRGVALAVSCSHGKAGRAACQRHRCVRLGDGGG